MVGKQDILPTYYIFPAYVRATGLLKCRFDKINNTVDALAKQDEPL